MLIIAILGIGLVAGWLAQLLLHRSTSDRGEALAAGLVGSFVGGIVASLISTGDVAFRPSGLIGSTIGAMVVLAVWGGVLARR